MNSFNRCGDTSSLFIDSHLSSRFANFRFRVNPISMALPQQGRAMITFWR
jgi:hypothetical protein